MYIHCIIQKTWMRHIWYLESFVHQWISLIALLGFYKGILQKNDAYFSQDLRADFLWLMLNGVCSFLCSSFHKIILHDIGFVGTKDMTWYMTTLWHYTSSKNVPKKLINDVWPGAVTFKKTRPTPISRVRDIYNWNDLEWLKMT